MTKRIKLIVVVGPTASGKSDLAVTIAKTIGGEVVSADSRQMYHGLDIGTGKVTQREMRGVPHHLLDVSSPKRTLTVVDYKRMADAAIADIARRGKVPILCGGTGFYIQAVVDNVLPPEVAPNMALRKVLIKKSTRELFEILTTRDPRRAKEIDAKNPHRLIRAIEIAHAMGRVPIQKKTSAPYDTLLIGITLPDKELHRRIRARLSARMRRGMLAEAKRLHVNGLSWKRMKELGLEYRYLAEHVQGNLTKKEMLSALETAIQRYAKRQKTWFKRDKRINWFSPAHTTKILTLTKNFMEETSSSVPALNSQGGKSRK
ncbi:MAG: tRNA (adenosine(37)-N6)-dimethylallyltransferase MiaA [Minisyncoccota bacterium]